MLDARTSRTFLHEVPYSLENGFRHITEVSEDGDDILSLLEILERRIRSGPSKFKTMVDAGWVARRESWFFHNPYSWLVTVEAVALDILVRFGTQWMIERY